jgi:ATP-dependent DNA helicase RecQ
LITLLDYWDVVITRAAATLGYYTVKREQMTVIRSFLHGKDVFAVLPTGYGKTLCYASLAACLPLIFDSFIESQSSIVIVLTPLIAVMKDQVHSLNRKAALRVGCRAMKQQVKNIEK